jgi:hypothetical protein
MIRGKHHDESPADEFNASVTDAPLAGWSQDWILFGLGWWG